jgi:outer membrane protein assembly factor BamE
MMIRTAPYARQALAVLALAALGGCAYMPSMSSLSSLPSVAGDKVLGLVTPYRLEVVQGNVLTKEQVARIKPGMSRLQVRDTLGSPMLTDAFHGDRWDYLFTMKRQGEPEQRRHVIAWFDGEKLKSLDVPDDLPKETDFVASVSPFKPKGNPPKLELTEAERNALPAPAKMAAPTVEPMGVLRSYPPLEPRS